MCANGIQNQPKLGCSVTPKVQYTRPMVREHDEYEKIRKVAVRTVKKSMAAVSAR
jgi:hypothetical protein